ncbi:MAG: conjugal transfer protein TraG N-terminal domain-containing protein [Betaproteobacteria bacterium]|nr:conjugal transfer protein TraG N-terminal domain-containing protein [Betaproteobacteria bacterium]
MNFSYVAWGSGEIVVQAFSALALISLSPEMIGALSVVVLAAILMSSSSAALSGNMQAVLVPARVTVVALVAIGVLLIPADVIVEDRFSGQEVVWPGHGRPPVAPRVVAGVPMGVAAAAGFASLLGEQLTNVVETAMGAVDDQDRLSASGLWLSVRALQALAAGRGEVLDASLAHDMRMFLENCTYFDVLAGRVSTQQLVREPVLRSLANTSGGFTSLHAGSRGSGALVPVTCAQAWNGNGDPDPVTGVAGLAARIGNEGANRQFQACQSLRGLGLAVDDASRRAAQRQAATPDVHGASCGSGVFAKSLQVFGYVPSVAEAFSDVVAIELMQDYAYSLAGQSPLHVAFAKHTAARQRDATYVIAGELAATALPALRGLLEAVLIVMMPVLLIIGILMFEQLGSYLKNGILMVLWLHMWPPVIAVINAVGSWVQEIAINEQSILSQGQFTVGALAALQSEIDVQLALSRYLLVVTPLLAYALVKSGEIGGALLAGRLLMPGEAAAGSSGGSVALNNWNADQVNLAPRTQVGSAMMQVRDPYGGVATHYEQASVHSMPSNEPGYLQVRQASAVATEIRNSSVAAQTQAHSQEQRYSSSVESAFESALGAEGREILSSVRAQGVQDHTSYRALKAMSESAQVASATAEARGDEQTLSGRVRLSTGGSLDWLPLVDVSGLGSEESRAAVSNSFSESVSSQDQQTRNALREFGQGLERAGRSELSVSASAVTTDSYRARQGDTDRLEQSSQLARSRPDTLSAAASSSIQDLQAVSRDLLADPDAYRMLSAYHRLRTEDGLEHSHAWSEAQRQSGYQVDVDEVARRVLGSTPELAAVPDQLPAGADLAGAHEQRVQRVQESQPEAPEAPADLTGPGRLEQQQQSLADEQMRTAPQIVGREPMNTADEDRKGLDKHFMLPEAMGNIGGRESAAARPNPKEKADDPWQ